MSAIASYIGRFRRWVPPAVLGLSLAIAIPLAVSSGLNLEMSRLTSQSKEHKATADEFALIQRRASVFELEFRKKTDATVAELALIRKRASVLESELRKEIEAIQNESEILRQRASALESELLVAKQGISTLRHRRIPSKEVSSSLVAIGVEWNDTPKDRSHVWYGTGFGLSDSTLFATAAHVIQEGQDQQADFEKKGVPSRIVIRYPDAVISNLTHAKLHPRFNRSNRNTDEPSCDIAVFAADPSRQITRLQLAEAMIPEIGDEVFVAGFPQSVPQIQYPISLKEPFVPTVRCGRVERLIDVDDLAKSSQRNLLQLDVPLVGGFSGSPVVNFGGKVVGIAVFATHRHIKVMGADGAKTTRGDTTRILDAAHVSFAVSATLLRGMIEEIDRETIPNGPGVTTEK